MIDCYRWVLTVVKYYKNKSISLNHFYYLIFSCNMDKANTVCKYLINRNTATE